MSEPFDEESCKKKLKQLEEEIEELRKKKMVTEEPIEEEPYKKELKQIRQIFKGTETTFKKVLIFLQICSKNIKLRMEIYKVTLKQSIHVCY